jgi:excinuclease ABC subunit C
VQSIEVTDDFAHVRRAMRADCPLRPGVYGVVDRAEQLIYVGMSASLRNRLTCYFQGGSTLRKERCIAAHAQRLIWEVSGHEFAALLRELELIRRHQPRFNVKGRQPLRPLGFIYLSRESAPRFRVARRVPKGVRHGWGPLSLNWRIRDAIEIVNRLFKLCDCASSVPMYFADQRQLFSLELRLQCLRGETGSCLGPCAAQCTTGQYSSQLRAARAFLDGKNDSIITELEHQLQDAAQSQQYERAARLRDWQERLRYLTDQLTILRAPPLPERFVYPLIISRRTIWYLIAGSTAVAAVSAPSSSDSARRCLRQMDRSFRSQELKQPEVDRPAAQIVSSWFRSHPAEVQQILSEADARAICHSVLKG